MSIKDIEYTQGISLTSNDKGAKVGSALSHPIRRDRLLYAGHRGLLGRVFGEAGRDYNLLCRVGRLRASRQGCGLEHKLHGGDRGRR